MFRSRFRSTPSGDPADHVVSEDWPERNTNPRSRHQSFIGSRPAPPRTSTILSFASDDTGSSIQPAGGLLFSGPGAHVPLDPLGLQIAYEPNEPVGDIVFVHGLGGSAWRTWCWDRDIANFWPQWLPEDAQLSSFRISTFGYNARFKGAASNLDIVDFAKDLLLQLYTTFRHDGSYAGPIIFVAHSMGGLIVKKAYMLGKYDKQYSDLIANVFGIIFLATPHRGSSFAKLLNNILAAAPLRAPPKAYITDLGNQSSSIQEINASFKQHCQGLSLVSFYETLKTSLGLTKAIIVEKDSAVLEYQNEVSASLDADHHTVCKYKGRADPNFIKVKGMLKAWILSQAEPERPALLTQDSSYAEVMKKVQSILGIQDPGDSDNNFEFIRSLLANGSGRWLLKRKHFSAWFSKETEGDMVPLTFWLIGPPGKGKTVLSAGVIDYLHSQDKDFQYHLFSQGHQNRRTVAYCLRSIASQIARRHEAFRDALTSFSDETGISFKSESHTFQYLWDKIFVGILFKLELDRPLWWVLDGIDEADKPSTLITSLRMIQARTPIKIYLSSRPVKFVSLLDKSRLTTHFLQDSDTALDVQTYTETAVRNEIPDNAELQDYVMQKIIENAAGSFLWVRLALETLENNWYTRETIETALTSVPRGMLGMYKRMVDNIIAQQPRTRYMATLILTWAACSWRPLSLDEMKAALEPEFKDFTISELTINHICGHFINLEQTGGSTATVRARVSLIHATAREYLLKGEDGREPFIDPKEAHKIMAIRCLTYLSHDRWKQHYSSVHRAMSISKQTRAARGMLFLEDATCPLLGYATYYWAYHVSKAPTGDPDLLKAMGIFFSKYCLSWIEGVALSGNLQYLSRAAQHLKVYVKRGTRRKSITEEDVGMTLSLVSLKDFQSDYDWIQGWAVDLIRVVGKFGSNLVRNPPSIYRHVPAFCPRESMIGKTFGDMQSRLLTVQGLPSENWDDCLASVNVGREDCLSSQVLATETFFLTLANASGTILVWGTDTCEKVRTICQGEWVTMMALNRAGTLVATAGYQTFGVWELASGTRLHCFPRTSSAKVLDIKFGTGDTQLLAGLDNCTVAYHDIVTGVVRKTFVAKLPDHDAGYVGCPGSVAISHDLSKVAMSWRGRVPLVWELNHTPSLPPYRCRVKGPSDPLLYPSQIHWQPETNSLLILCASLRLVEWRIYDEYQAEYDHIRSPDIAVSNDGNLLLSKDNEGTMSIWTFPRLSPVYRLLNTNEASSAMAFGPNCQRFYDIRGSMCNIWEPDVLIRPDEQDLEDTSSSGGSWALPEPTISSTGSGHILITAMAMSTSSNDPFFCYGREDGSVMIVDAHSGKRVRKVYSHGAVGDVLSLSWSKSGRYMVSFDDFGHVIAKRLQMKEEGKWAVFPCFETSLHGQALQLLFSADEKLLLISTPTEDFIWDLKSKTKTISRNWGTVQSRCWVQHPSRPELLIWVEPGLIRVFTWNTLEEQKQVRISSDTIPQQAAAPTRQHDRGRTLSADIPGARRPSRGYEQTRSVQWVSTAQAGNSQHYLVYATLPEERSVLWATDISAGGLRIEVLPLSAIDNVPPVPTTAPQQQQQHPTPPVITAAHMPTPLVSHVKILAGILGRTVVFLDHEGWLSTWDITAASPDEDDDDDEPPSPGSSSSSSHRDCDIDGIAGLTRHFFTPKDWLNTNTSHLAVVDGQGTLFVPKYGDVAIVRGGMRL